MIRFYSLFVTDDELLASPYVRRFNVFHDLTINLGKAETVNFLLQTSITPEQNKRLNVIYDPLTLDVSKVEVKTFNHQTLITATLKPKEIGSVRIGFSLPQSEPLHRSQLKKIPSSLTAVPYIKLSRKSRITKQRHDFAT